MNFIMKQPVIVSACLLGINCRYDGKSKFAEQFFRFCQQHGIFLLPICPEQLGGLSTPRPPACFRGGDGNAVVHGNAALYNSEGREVTSFFLAGARQALKIARLSGSRHAVLQDRSPSCGVHAIYSGNELAPGSGVTTALFKINGMEVWTVEEFSRYYRNCMGKE